MYRRKTTAIFLKFSILFSNFFALNSNAEDCKFANLVPSNLNNPVPKGEFKRSSELDVLYTLYLKNSSEINPNDLLLAMKRHLDNNNIAYKIAKNESGENIIELLQVPGQGSQFNNFLHKIGTRFEVKRFTFDPFATVREMRGAAFDPQTKGIEMDFESLLNLKNTPYLAHELVHAKTDRNFARGLISIDSGAVQGTLELPLKILGYETFARMDEMKAYFETAIQLIKKTDLKNGETFTTKIAELRKVLKSYRNQSLSTVGHAADIFNDFAKGNLVKRVFEKGTLALESVTNDGQKIWLQAYPTKDFPGLIVRVTRMNKTTGKMGQSFIFPLDFKKEFTSADISNVMSLIDKSIGNFLDDFNIKNQTLKRLEALAEMAESAPTIAEREKIIQSLREMASRRR